MVGGGRIRAVGIPRRGELGSLPLEAGGGEISGLGGALKAALAPALCIVIAAAPATADIPWRPKTKPVNRYIQNRAGTVSYAVINENGRMWGRHRHRTVESVSVVKAMLLVTYLRMNSVRDRKLRGRDRDLLGPMIKVSNSTTASRARDIVGHGRINELARDAKMMNFRVVQPWGASQITARDQARFFFKIRRFIPKRHEDYALWLLAHVVGHQRWGMAGWADKRMPRWDMHFKGGWGSGTGRWNHQVALFEKGKRRLVVAILTEFSPSHAYASRTLRGVARRLLRSR